MSTEPFSQQPIFSTTYDDSTPIPFPDAQPKIAATLPGRIRSFDISPDSKTIAFATSKGLVLYDLETYKLLHILNEAEGFYKVRWSPDGSKLAADGVIQITTDLGKSQISVWDTSSWKNVFEQTGPDETLMGLYGDLAWSPDNHSLAESLNQVGVLVHNIQTGNVISEQDMLNSYSMAWSPDGTRLAATGDLAYGIRRWVVDTNGSVRLFDQRASSSMQIAWSPDGKRIASGHAGGTVCFWTVTTNQCDGFIKAHQDAVFSLVWSPDGNQLATGGGIIRVWDSHTGQLNKSFGLSDTSIYTQLEWLGINQPLVSVEAGYADDELTIVRFWDVTTGSVLMEFQGASGSFGQ
jgi:WD40 repeat protein